MGEGTRGRGEGSKGFGSGGVGGRGTGPRDGANCVVFLAFLARTKRRKMACFEGCPVGWGRVQGLGEGGPRALVPGGVGGRGTGPRDGANFATCVVFLTFLTRTKRRKIAFFEGFPVGWGRVQRGAERGPRALVPGGRW